VFVLAGHNTDTTSPPAAASAQFSAKAGGKQFVTTLALTHSRTLRDGVEHQMKRTNDWLYNSELRVRIQIHGKEFGAAVQYF